MLAGARLCVRFPEDGAELGLEVETAPSVACYCAGSKPVVGG